MVSWEMDVILSQQAQASRILVAISFHYVTARLRFLAEVLRSLAEFPVAELELVIVTNRFKDEDLALLRRLCTEALAGRAFSIQTCDDSADRWQSIWQHKQLITGDFLGARRGLFTHFIYLESDIRLSFVNFCYFLQYREVLRASGLLPAFVRVEYSQAQIGFTTSDVFWPVYVPVQAHLRIGNTVFVNMPNPYNPFYILDIGLAEEYRKSPSFDREESRKRANWNDPDRSAMGLCLENVPPPFHCRYVVPVSGRTGGVPAAAWVWHLPNNYADNPDSVLGKVRMDELFAGVPGLPG